MIDCRHWSACGIRGGGCCALGIGGGRPSLGVCGACLANPVPAEERAAPAEAPLPAVPAEELQRRMAVCRLCPELQKVSSLVAGVSCRACGCGLRMVRDGCPLGKF